MKVRFTFIIAIILNLVFQNAFANTSESDSLDIQSIRYRNQLRQELELKELRDKPLYKRIYQICGNSGIHFGQLKYTLDAINQVINLTSPDELNRVIFTRERLSKQLTDDLSDPAFFQAMKDCGYTAEQSGLFVISLISADLSGKAIGTIGMITFFKRMSGAMAILKERAPKVFYALIGSGMIGSIYTFYKDMFQSKNTIESETSSINNKNKGSISNANDLEKYFPKENPNDINSTENLKKLTLEALNLKIKNAEEELKNNSLSEYEREEIAKKIQKMKIKYRALELS